jgi:hypothetical protein
MRLFHGGVPGLRAGDLIEPGHERKVHDGCAWCAARAQLPPSADGLALQVDRVYLTPERLYARHYASLYGRGDLYRVEPVGELQRSTEDTVETWTAPAARVVAALDRAVVLSPSERRRLYRLWGKADEAHLAAYAAQLAATEKEANT